MIKLFIVFSVSFFFQTFSQASGGGLIVGNTGNGILVNDQVILQDFHEAGLIDEEQLYLGDKVDLTIYNWLQKQPNFSKLSIDLAKFAKKISHLNSISPALGTYLLMASTQYQFILVEDIGTWQSFYNGRNDKRYDYIPLAVRRFQTIAFSSVNWERLSEGNKIGLLLHELFFSLLKENCDPMNICDANHETVRHMTALTFDQDITKKANTLKAAYFFEQSLKIPSQKICVLSQMKSVIVLEWWKASEPYSLFLTEAGNVARAKAIRDFCEKTYQKFNSKLQVNLTIHREMMLSKISNYKDISLGTQRSVSIEPEEYQESHILNFDFSNGFENCATQIAGVLSTHDSMDLFKFNGLSARDACPTAVREPGTL